jgi:5-methylcytosine-specific restriction protein B
MKSKIRDGLADRIGGPTGDDPAAIDRDLLAIRAALAPVIERPFHFWTAGVKELWDSAHTESSSTVADSNDLNEPRPRHYWLYAPGAQASEWEEFSAHGIMAIGWDELDDLASYASREAIRQALDLQGTGRSLKNDVLAVWQFQNEMAVGDIVYAKRGRRKIVGRGEVTSDARFEPTRALFRHLRSVRWDHIGSWDHPGDAVLKTLTDITTYHDYVEKLEALVTGELEEEELVITTPLPSYDKASFLSEVYLSEAQYERLSGLLRRKKNVILAGPPGVGKTYAAKRLAYSIMGTTDLSRVQMVQFHQSYSYEDFMMGTDLPNPAALHSPRGRSIGSARPPAPMTKTARTSSSSTRLTAAISPRSSRSCSCSSKSTSVGRSYVSSIRTRRSRFPLTFTSSE